MLLYLNFGSRCAEILKLFSSDQSCDCILLGGLHDRGYYATLNRSAELSAKVQRMVTGTTPSTGFRKENSPRIFCDLFQKIPSGWSDSCRPS